MALKMTRTRTQTALTKLAELVANVHGELETVERLLGEAESQAGELAAIRAEGLLRRRQVLHEQRNALYATLKQFDPQLNPADIGATQDWLKQFGQRVGKAALARYMRWVLSVAPESARTCYGPLLPASETQHRVGTA